MNKLLLSLTLSTLAWTAQADGGLLTALTITNDISNYIGRTFTSGAYLPYEVWRDGRSVLTLTRADYESTKDANITLRVAKVYSQLRTNVEVQASVFAQLAAPHFSCAVLHAIGDVCDFEKHQQQQQWPSTEVTTILKERVAEIEGQQFVLAREVVSRTERTFTLKTTTERVYSEATTSNPAFFTIGK